MLLIWKVAPALAMGNTVVLKPATVTRLSALLFAEICAEAGLPPGVFNVVTGGGAMGQILATHPDVDKVAFTGSTEIGKILKQAIAGSGKKISLVSWNFDLNITVKIKTEKSLFRSLVEKVLWSFLKMQIWTPQLKT